jgi:aspartyl-tRNA(Asn)/glutamyl-tRNA(Gln) amidotransferase subunit B
MNSSWEAVIGLEVHCQLATQSKIFCSCPAQPVGYASVADVPPNLYTCPVCTGQPGSLPTLNAKAVELAVRAGLATGCAIREKSVFARKNYFYADLPKGYQISQYELPICENGSLTFSVGDSQKTVHIQRIHMEEDAGKLVHQGGETLVNLNRAGVPLVEIVSAPELRSPEEAGAYMRALHSIVTSIGVSDGNMQEGNFRCDANVSVRPRGQKEFGTRVEIKNVNSFRFVEKAITHEIDRQISEIESGRKIIQETRLYDSEKDLTISMRTKEDAEDYRYFPDPDLPPLVLETAFIEGIRRELPELPSQKKERYQRDFGLSAYDSEVLTFNPSLTQLFDRSVPPEASSKTAKIIANLLTQEVARLSNEEGVDPSQSKLAPQHLVDLCQMQDEGKLSSSNVKKALQIAWRSGGTIAQIAEKEGLVQMNDKAALEKIVRQVLDANPAQVAELKGGKEKVIGFLVGQVMKTSGGKANPALVQTLIRRLL